MVEKIFKITAVILIVGIINVGTGLGLGLLMVSSIIVSIVFLSVCLTLMAITSLYKLIKKW
jgi:hypothetical protein